MPLLVASAADTHPALEVASWIVAIVAFALVILQLILYWFGRQAPLHIRARGYDTRTEEGKQILLLNVEFRSRTRDTQTVRELVLFDPPNSLSRALRPRWYEKEIPVTPVTLPSPLPRPVIVIDGHDTAEVRVAFNRGGLAPGSPTRLKVRASRRRPHVARIRMEDEPDGATQAPPPQPAVSQAAEVSAAPAAGAPSPEAGEGKTQEPDPVTSDTHRLRASTRPAAGRMAQTVRRYAPAAAAFIVLMASALSARVILNHQRCAGDRTVAPGRAGRYRG
jgi:hypothetical protein